METTLRPVEERDRDLLRAWRNQPDVSRFMHTEHVIGAEEHAAWFTRMLRDASTVYWVIEVDGRPVGAANLTGIDRTHRRCSKGSYLADPSVRGRGVGGWVEHQLISHAFERLGLEKLCCEVLAFNHRAHQLYVSFGFREEGRLRRHVLKADGWCDVIVLGLLREEWAAARPAAEERLRRKGLLAPVREAR